jgi:hypothetical protein
MNIYDHQLKYERWWLNKRCRLAHSSRAFSRVVKVMLYGPPSFIYGCVFLHFDDGSNAPVMHGNSFKPRKCDVEVERALPECELCKKQQCPG